MYHIALDLKDKKVTIIGGGKVAYRKAWLLSQENCILTIIAPHFIKAFHSLDTNVHRIYKRYEKGDCKGSTLVFAATDDSLLNEVIQQDCKMQHILCNVVSDKTLSDFITPAQVSRGDLTLSVSTNGQSPTLAAAIKEELEVIYGEDYKQKVELLGQIRRYYLSQNREEKPLKELIKLSNDELIKYWNQLNNV